MKAFLFLTTWAFALWLIALNVRIVLSFVQTDRRWVLHRPNPAQKVRPGRFHRARVVLHYLGCALSVFNPVLEPLRPLLASAKHALWLLTEPVVRLVRKLPVKFSITTQRRQDCAKRDWKARLARAEQPVRQGMVLDFGPGLVLLASYGLVMRALVVEHASANPSPLLAVMLWAAFGASVALFLNWFKAARQAS